MSVGGFLLGGEGVEDGVGMEAYEGEGDDGFEAGGHGGVGLWVGGGGMWVGELVS